MSNVLSFNSFVLLRDNNLVIMSQTSNFLHKSVIQDLKTEIARRLAILATPVKD
jgi:hypothetical protein